MYLQLAVSKSIYLIYGYFESYCSLNSMFLLPVWVDLNDIIGVSTIRHKKRSENNFEEGLISIPSRYIINPTLVKIIFSETTLLV